MNTKTGQPDTKQLILDSAEYLFANKGFRGTSMRAITGRARVNIAAVNYHFGSKKTLLEAVIKRRIYPLNQIRRAKLEQVINKARKKGKKPDVRDVLYAFIQPTLQFRETEPGAKDFITFIGRSFADPDNTVRRVFVQFIKPMFQLLSQSMSEALPKLSHEIIFWRLQFTMGALFHTLHICGDINMGHINIDELDTIALIDLIIPYVTAGMEAK
jgi:AcrR family transcriptional regulator